MSIDQAACGLGGKIEYAVFENREAAGGDQ
jgi:hypothetical protein